MQEALSEEVIHMVDEAPGRGPRVIPITRGLDLVVDTSGVDLDEPALRRLANEVRKIYRTIRKERTA